MEQLVLCLCLLKKPHPNPTTNAKTTPKQQKRKGFYLRRSIPNMKKNQKQPHAHSRKIVDCLILLECFTKSLISPYGIKKSQQFLILHLYFTNTPVERSCKFYSQFFSVLRSLYSILRQIAEHKFHITNMDDHSGEEEERREI